MKNIIATLFLCVAFTMASAQKKQNVYFFKTNGVEVKLKDSADFVRLIQEPDSGETNFVLQEFYVSGKRKTLGKISAFEPRLVYEGVILRFDTAGKRKEITNYEKGVPLGMSYHYLSNGKLHRQTEYLAFVPKGNVSSSTPSIPIVVPGMGFSEAPYNPNSKLIYYADSLGNVQVQEGNGHFIRKKASNGELIDEGDYKDGVKHGVWKGSGPSPGASFVETYEMGKLINGETTKDGVKYPYSTDGEPPSFKGGIKKFYEYLGYSIRYPSDAVKEKIEGTVIVEFTVERDGRTSDILIKKSVFPSLDNVARQVIKFSPKWIPGVQRGIPVRVKYTIPIKFTLPR